jgi:hypothetical protein
MTEETQNRENEGAIFPSTAIEAAISSLLLVAPKLHFRKRSNGRSRRDFPTRVSTMLSWQEA